MRRATNRPARPIGYHALRSQSHTRRIATRTWFAVLLIALCPLPSAAGPLDALSEGDAAGGLRQALTQGAAAAVEKLGRADGFLGNPKVRIPLPEGLRQAEGLMRALGMGKQAGELTLAMNRAAEDGVARAKPILVAAVKKMTVDDARRILTGADDGATQYFRRTTSAQLTEQFLPIVTRATEKVGLAAKYNELAGRAAKFGLLEEKDAKIERYVTGKALDGLFLIIAEEERAIRTNPLGAAGNLAKKVFGLLR
ncbi:MAG TPA: DUF4197 domain-containing protein [Rhodocyclaceae bacterium]|nr:MAG: DUF4197 domain-containing protein [Rhodocyclales bacterium CG_4_10_14_3_um_filter_68_10]PJA57418.1 MAG: DUF4197 domain-containing protein [Rhodocyclales bacterium CG_4_9_14_3_um_filter_68_10]HCX34055.1 DUF4197 domain-containing protein [Rhodocyclaceae bacterium]